ncbi:MAG: type I DNA topoisomerase [Lentisphaeria bacterium]|nr:type I DNA topoisomerase [Lentisphaeria bacterium]
MSKLVIVESPTKAGTIGRMLDNSYRIVASMGHVRDLPERSIGVDIENNFTPLYVDTPRSRKIVADLKKMARSADEIYLAPDPDREGEAIAWHLQELLKTKQNINKFHRVTFHEITSTAIKNAMANKGVINMDLVDAQQARRVLDRIVGYKVSPLLWQKLEKGMSAGRVQSVALRLIVERERLIQDFKPQEYWNFLIVFANMAGFEVTCKLFKINGENFVIDNETAAAKLLDNVLNHTQLPIVKNLERADRRRFPYPPFTTSTMQQAASSFLHFSPSSTMKYAQELYEGVEIGAEGSVGLITYMRTDSVNIAKEAQLSCRNFIEKHYGSDYVPAKFNVYKSKSSAQEAHEAIRPTDVNRTPESLKNVLSEQQLKLYTLIWQRFVASQMTPAIYTQTTLDVEVIGADKASYIFRNSVSVPKFAGCTVVYNDERKEEGNKENATLANMLNSLQLNELMRIVSADKEQKFTEPPPHFSEASLIKELEENGVGRPSTYASIIKTIIQRKYVEKEKSKLIPTESGYQVNDFLVGNLPELFDVGFTAQMEEQLDEVESGKLNWTNMLKDFYSQFEVWLNQAKIKDAPASSDAEILVKLFDNVKFNEPQKVGRRIYDDGKFMNSIREKFAKDGTISTKQYAALITLAAKYSEQLDLNLPETMRSEINEALDKLRGAEIAKEQNDNQEVLELFNSFSQVKWQEASSANKRFFDEKKFFNSLKKQAEAGKILSEKQLSVLKRLAEKYANDLLDKSKVFAFLGIEENSDATAPTSEANVNRDEAIKLLVAKLSQVKNWTPPVKKGRFTYDDKAFFNSIAKQLESGKILSDKQFAALKKLAAKY